MEALPHTRIHAPHSIMRRVGQQAAPTVSMNLQGQHGELLALSKLRRHTLKAPAMKTGFEDKLLTALSKLCGYTLEAPEKVRRSC